MKETWAKMRELWGQGLYRESLRELVIFLFAVDSIGSIFTRGAIWFGIAIAIIVGMDTYDKHHGEGANLKSSLGFFLVFLILGGVLMYTLFGFAPFITTANAGN